MNILSSLRTALAAAGLSLLLSTAHAVISYNYSLDTTALNGTAGTLAFDFINGDNVTNNTVTISGLATDGTVTGSTNFSLADVNFFNEELRNIVFGTTLSFTVDLTEAFAGGTPDSFSFYLLDANALNALYPTTDPTGLNASLYADVTNVIEKYDAATVPDSGNTLALASLGALGLMAFARKVRPVAA